jgi:putative redox protein
MATRPFDFTGAEGQRLSGRLDLPDGKIQAYALFAHCFTCSKASVASVRIARALAAKGVGVLRFDFTGLGQSGGDFADSTFSGSVRDLIAAAYAMASEGLSPNLLIGHSLGGAAALAAAPDLPDIAAVATIGAPFNVEHVTRLFGDGLQTLLDKGEAEVNLGGRPFKLRRDFVDDLRLHDDQGARIAALRRPLLIMHSPVDRIVDIENASSIFLAARHPKSFVALDKADHLLSRAEDSEYAAEVIAAWASRYVAARIALRAQGQDGRVVVEETGEGEFQVEVLAGGARLLVDEPPEVGGLGSGPTPYDLIAAALGACTAMTLRLYAKSKAWSLERVRVTVGRHTEPAASPPDIFTREIAITGDLDPSQRARLMEIAERCPVHRTLERGSQILTHAESERPPAAVDDPTQHARDMEQPFL